MVAKLVDYYAAAMRRVLGQYPQRREPIPD